MFKRLIPFVFVLFSLSQGVKGQASMADTSVFIPYLSINYALYVPGGDLDDRFGLTNSLGASFTIKLANNFTFGINGSSFFGSEVKEENMLHEMRTDNGDILDDNAIISQVLFMERGFEITGEVGKIFHFGRANYNSGLFTKIGAGYNTHWIRIENQENNIPQLTKETKKYYDRKVAGLLLTEFIGYQHFSDKGLVNFTAGFEFMQGFNSDFRTYNIDDKAAVSDNRLDLYFGFKVGWLILFRKTMSTAYYVD